MLPITAAVLVERPLKVRVRFPVRSPPPERGNVVLMVVALDAGVNPKREEEATWYVAPALAAMRPLKEAMEGAFVKVCVPSHVFEVVVPKAREKTAPDVPIMAGELETESG